MKKSASFSLNFDSLFCYRSSKSDRPDPSFFKIADRFFYLAQKYNNFKYTIFIIGKDLESPEIFSRVREWSDAGHEIGNHSYSHNINLGTLPKNKIEYEVLKAHELITKCIGKEPRGFISPSWSASGQLADILIKENYLYDTSMFPTWLVIPFLLILRATNRKELITYPSGKEIKNRLLNFIAPKTPYFVSSKSVIKEQERGLLMIPLPVTPVLQIPCWHTVSLIFEEKSFSKFWSNKILYKCLKKYDNFYYVMHPADLLDMEHDITQEEKKLLSGFERMDIALQTKMRSLTDAMNLISEGRRIITLEEMAKEIMADGVSSSTPANLNK